MAERKSGGTDLLAGLGAVGTSSVMSKPKITLPPAPPDFERLNHYYCDVLTESRFVPEEFPSSLPLNESGQKFDLGGSKTRLWKELAAYHKTSVRSLKKEYLKWRCDKDGMPYDETILAESIMCQNRLGDSNIQKFGSDPEWAINNFMEWDEPQLKSEQQNISMSVSEEYITSLYYFPEESCPAIDATEEKCEWGKVNPTPMRKSCFANDNFFHFLLTVGLFVSLALSIKYDGIGLIGGIAFLVVPLIILRNKATK